MSVTHFVQLILTSFWVVVVTSSNTPCVCTSHVQTKLWPRPNMHLEPIGFMYQDECKAFRYEPEYQHPGFLAIQHYHQVAYVEEDADTYATNCTNFIFDVDDKLTSPVSVDTNTAVTSTAIPFLLVTSTSIPASMVTNTAFPASLDTNTAFPASLDTNTAYPVSLDTNTAVSSTATASPLVTSTAITASLLTSTVIPASLVTRTAIPASLVTSTVIPASLVTRTAIPASLVTSKAATSTMISASRITTTAVPPPPRCNKFALFNDIALKINVGTDDANRCVDGIHHDADAAVMAFCKAPDPTRWLTGIKVLNSCDSVPKYSPIATFDQSAVYEQSAGILLGCGEQSFYIATQNCTSTIHIRQITKGSNPPIDKFYVIEW